MGLKLRVLKNAASSWAGLAVNVAVGFFLLFGMSQHKPLAIMYILGGIANVALSILLIRPLGIVGDAIGTANPLLCTAILFLPRHLYRRLQAPIRSFLWEVYFYPALFCIPMACALVLMQRFHYAHRYPQLLANLTVGIAVYGACAIWLLLTREAFGPDIRRKVAGYFAQGRVS